MRSAKAAVIASAVLANAFTTSQALAQPAAPARALLEDRWVVSVGAFVLNSKVRASLNGQSGHKPEIDFDEAFGRSSDATRIRADAMWRVTPRNHLRLMYFSNTIDRSRVIDRAIEWGDYTFGLGANIDSTYRTETVQLAYEYAFVRQPDYEVAASLGVHHTKTTIRLSGTAVVTDEQGNATSAPGATSANSLTAPLPVVGLRAGWVVAPQWHVHAQALYFRAEVGGYGGYWSDLRVGATWMFNRNFGIGLGYNRFATHLQVERGSFDGSLRTGYAGLQAYLTAAF